MKHIVKSDVGVYRKENQDKAGVFSQDNITLAVLCDGMGGHAGGFQAANITIENFSKSFKKSFPKNHDAGSIAVWFKETLKKSKEDMKLSAGKDEKLLDMGTTVVAAVIFPDRVCVLNVGDSRAYVYNSALSQVTIDQNLKNYYINEHNMDPWKASRMVGSNALTSALGPKKMTKIDPINFELDKRIKYIILTSDGIHDFIEKPLFEKIVHDASNLEEMATKLIKEGLNGRSTDNLTTAIVEIE